MNDVKNIFGKYGNSLKSILQFGAKHRIIFVILISSAVIIVAINQSRSFLDPERNDTKYTELKAEINYSEIDQEIVDKLSKTQEDKNIEVDPSLVPNRNNPFSE